jgi:hypothetical protein
MILAASQRLYIRQCPHKGEEAIACIPPPGAVYLFLNLIIFRELNQTMKRLASRLAAYASRQQPGRSRLRPGPEATRRSRQRPGAGPLGVLGFRDLKFNTLQGVFFPSKISGVGRSIFGLRIHVPIKVSKTDTGHITHPK